MNIKNINPDEPSKITFDNDEWEQSTHSVQSQAPKIIQWVITYSGGYIKNKKQAMYVLLGFFVIAIIFSFILFVGPLEQTTPSSELPYQPGSTVIDDDAVRKFQLP